MLPALLTTPSPAQVSATRAHKRRRGAKLSSRAQSKEAHIPSPPRSRSISEELAKRRNTEQNTALSPVRPAKRKRTKSDPAPGTLFLPGFWDRLSRVPLAKSSLAELDRRNAQVAAGSIAASVPDLRLPGPQACLELSRYARQGGPDLSGLRGFELMPSTSGRQNTKGRGAIQKPGRKKPSRGSGRCGSRKTGETKTSSPYDAAFKQHLIDGHVWPIHHYLESGLPDEPNNLQDMTRRICGHPDSLDPEVFTSEDFRAFHKAYSIAASEEAQSRTLDIIERALSLSLLHIKRGPVKFSNLCPLLPDNLVPGNPDRVWGAPPEALDIFVRQKLQEFILPTAERDIMCPNLLVHVQGPDGSLEVAKLQAVYDGALAARGMEALWAYGRDMDGGACADQTQQQARTISCTFADGALRLYSVHCRSRFPGRCPGDILLLQPPESWSREVEYITTLIRTFPVLDNADEFRRGAVALRHALEWARQERDEAVKRANTRRQRDPAVERAKTVGVAVAVNRREMRAGSSGSEYQSSQDPLSGP